MKFKSQFYLTNREEEILGYLVLGDSYKMITDKCCVSYSTVNSHMTKIYEKLDVSIRAEAFAKAISNKMHIFFV